MVRGIMTTLANVQTAIEPRAAAIVAGRVLDLRAAHLNRPSEQNALLAEVTDLHSVLRLGTAGIAAVLRVIAELDALDVSERDALLEPLESVQLAAPVTSPPKIVCVARNYAAHAAEAGRPVSEIPILFGRFANTIVRPGGDVVVPSVSHQVDWEGELAVVIGKPGRAISQANAMDYVAGYSIFNDVSVRDFQFRTTQYTAGKNFAATGPFGPYLVLPDEIPDPHRLDLVTRVNGEAVQHANTSEMLFSIPEIIEHISEFIDLEIGDVIPMGTPSGVGFTRTPPRFLAAGDVVSVEIEGLGELRNPVVNERNRHE